MRFQLLQSLLCALPLADALPFETRVAKTLRRYGVQPQDAGDSHILKRSNSSSSFVSPTNFENVTWDVQNWRLQSTVLDQGHYQSRASLANGYLGINVASAGPFFELDTPVDGDVINGWPLFSRRQTFATIAGFYSEQPSLESNQSNYPWLYQYGGESPIAGIPHWGGLILDLGNGGFLDATVDNKTISNYTSVYDYKANTISWSYTWTPKNHSGSFDIQYLLFANKLNINQAVVQMSVTASSDSQANVVNVLEGYAAVRTTFVDSGEDSGAIFSAVKPAGINNVTAYVYAIMDGGDDVNTSSTQLVKDKPYLLGNASTIAQSVSVKFQAGKTITLNKFVGAASTDAFPDPRSVAKQAALMGKQKGFDNALRSHVSEWAQVMPDDSVDDFTYPNGTLPNDPFIVESSVMAVINPHSLLQNTVGENALWQVANAPVNDYSIPVGGLTSDSYAGLIFWDADVWMQPGLVAAFPVSAQRITNYRVAKYAQAKANIKTAFTSSQNKTHFSDDAALYPWTSGRYGNCTGTGPCFDYEYHLNGDIGISLVNQYVASGDNSTFKERYFPVYNSIATAFSNLLQKNGSSWTLTNMTDPDEYANNVASGGYTMPLISQTLTYANLFRKQFGMDQNTTWNDQAANVLIIRENDVTLEYTEMNNSVQVKQADVVLNTFPLDYTRNYAPSAALNDLDYYALKQSPNGPGMTYAIFSIVANEVSPSGCSAYTYAQYSYSPYIRGPWHQFSEQLVDDFTTNGGTHPAFPFLTGHGGANQVVLFGYLGLRYLPDNILHIDPNLPPQVPQVRYRTFYWRGWPISAMSNYTHTTISRAMTVMPLTTADQTYSNSSIKVQVGAGSNTTHTYNLPANGSVVVIPNRMVGSINTVSGNLIQCQSVQSSDAFQPGQFPISLSDGAASTKWQPEFANNLSSVTVTMPQSASGKMVSGFYFDWAQAPPVNATVVFHNNSINNPTVNLPLSNSTQNGNGMLMTHIRVNVSSPWDPKANSNDNIEIQAGNTTNYTFPSPVPAPKFATLFIQGSQGLDQTDIKFKNGTGATVAEWAILSA